MEHMLRALSIIAACAVSTAATQGWSQDRDHRLRDKVALPIQDPDNPLPELISGYYFGTLETRALQDDDFDNPGFLWVDQGEALWQQVEGGAGKSCASCHGDAAETMRGVAVRYPKYHRPSKKVINIEQRINLCRRQRMKAEPWAYESSELLAMTAFVRLQSRGLPVDVRIDGPAKPYFEVGRKLWTERTGQMEMSCSHCHDTHYGEHLRSDLLSQGHLNGFPVYRLKWQTLASTHRRFVGCHELIRATPYAYGSDEYIGLELYMYWRGNSLPSEAPAVRR